MKYDNGNTIRPGDVVTIDERDEGHVVASIDTAEYLDGYSAEEWAYLNEGILVVTDFAGLVHYTSGAIENIVLKERGGHHDKPD
jgi:hypothetical protein